MSALLPQPSAEQGFSLVETLVGALISVLVAGAVAMGLVESNDSALATQRQTQLLSVLQARIEWVHQLLTEDYSSTGFATIALSSNPEKGQDSSLPRDPSDPNDFIVSWKSKYVTVAGEKPWEGFLVEKNYNNTAQGVISTTPAMAIEGEQLQVDTTSGKIPPQSYFDITTGKTYSSESEVVTKNHPYATVNTYVTLASQDVSQVSGGCPTTAETGSTAADARRIIVVARYHGPGEQPGTEKRAGVDSTPQYATTLLTNPTPSNQCQNAEGFPL